MRIVMILIAMGVTFGINAQNEIGQLQSGESRVDQYYVQLVVIKNQPSTDINSWERNASSDIQMRLILDNTNKKAPGSLLELNEKTNSILSEYTNEIAALNYLSSENLRLVDSHTVLANNKMIVIYTLSYIDIKR